MNPKYQGYLGKNNDSIKSLSRASSTYLKYKDDEVKKEAENKLVEEQKKQSTQKKQDDKPWYEQFGGFLADSGKNIVSGVQQGAGLVADVALEGGALVGELGNQARGGSDAQKEQRRKGSLQATQNARDIVHGAKDIKGEEIKGATNADAAAAKIVDGTATGRDYATLAGTALDTGLAATQFLNPTQLLRGGAARAVETAGKTGLSIAGRNAKQVVTAATKGLTTKQALKVAGKDAALYGGLDAVATGTETYGQTGDLEQSLAAGAQAGVTSGLTQGILDVGGHAIGKAAGAKGAAATKSAEEVKAKAQEAADQADAKGVSDVADSLDNPLADVSDDDLKKQINDFVAGDGRTEDVKADYTRIQAVKDELSARERNQHFANGGKTVKEAQAELDAFDRGENLPDSVRKQAEPVTAAVEIMGRNDMPAELKSAAEEVVHDRHAAETQMYNLMSPQKKGVETDKLDNEYDAKLKELDKRYSSLEQPQAKGTSEMKGENQKLSGEYKKDVRYTVAKDRLDAEYKDNIAELDMMEAKDADEVAKYQDIMEKLDRRDNQVTSDANRLMDAAPDEFKDIDHQEMAAQREVLAKNLENAQRFDDGKGIVLEAATSPDPVKSIDANPDGRSAVQNDVAQSTDHLEGFKNVSSVRQATLGLLSPSKNLEAMGLRPLHDAIVVADTAQQLANKADIETISRIAAEMKKNDTLGDQVIDYLEGTRKTISTGDKEVAGMVKSFLDEKKEWLKQNGFDTIEEYFPHAFDVKNKGVQNLFKGKTTGDINFGNLKARKSDSPDYSKDIIDVLSQYSQGFNKKKFLEPALKPLEDIKTQDKVTDLESKWVDDYIKQLKGLGSSDVENGFNKLVDGVLGATGRGKNLGGNHYRAVLGGQRMISALGTMGLNPGTALRNMTQSVNTVAAIGPKWSTVGMVRGTRALLAGKNSPEFKEMTEAGVYGGGTSKNYNAELDEYSGKIPGLKGRANQVANKMMWMVSASDAALRAQAYWGAKALGVSKGMDEDAAKAFAREKVIDTQFMTSKVDMPTKLNGPGVRSLTQLATFSAKQAEFMAGVGLKTIRKDGKFHLDVASAGRLLAAGGAAAGATALLEPTIGFNGEEFIPFYSNIAPLIPGSKQNVSDALYRSPLVTLLAGDGKGKMGLIEAIQSGNPGEFIKDNWASVTPAGTQIKKSIEGSSTTNSGIAKNDKGDVRFLQDMDIESKVKASLFGQYATEAGKRWIDEGFPTLSDKQSAELSGKDREAQRQYYDYYSTARKATGRQEAYDGIKQAATDGDLNQAARLGKEFNDKVTTQMADYWKSHNDLPEPLRKQMLNKLYINVSNVVDRNTKE